MSKISNALNMYFLLMSRNMMTGKELADELEVSTRMIAEYKNDLELAGIYIGSKQGRYGGYYIEEHINLNKINFSENEKNALNIVNEIVKNNDQFYTKDFVTLVEKIKSNIDIDESYHYSKKSLKNKELKDKELELLSIIRKATYNNKKMKILYSKLGKNKIETGWRLIDPYITFNYKDGIYLSAYCNEKSNYRYFKLSRIKDYIILDEKFIRDKNYDVDKEISKSYGIHQGEKIDLELKIKYPSSEIVKERIYTENQEIKNNIDGSIVLKANMSGKTEIISWIKSMGSDVEIIKPIELKEEIIKDLEKTLSLYKD